MTDYKHMYDFAIEEGITEEDLLINDEGYSEEEIDRLMNSTEDVFNSSTFQNYDTGYEDIIKGDYYDNY